MHVFAEMRIEGPIEKSELWGGDAGEGEDGPMVKLNGEPVDLNAFQMLF